MSTYTRADVDAEIHKLLKSTQEMLEEFAESDEIGSAQSIARNLPDTHTEWLNGRSVAYRLVANHLDRLKEGYQQ